MLLPASFSRKKYLIGKRVFDVVFSLLFLCTAFILILAITICIKTTSSGPVLFVQERVGLNGRKFKMFKFRSMETDAERRLRSLGIFNELDGPVFKIKDDPRVTRVGKFLRKTSLDELPQFINVLKGEMSIVGPRPPLPEEVKQYQPWQMQRLSVKPGITCIWQVSGRNRVSFEEWVKMDLVYIDNCSFWLDFKLILKTLVAVVKMTGW